MDHVLPKNQMEVPMVPLIDKGIIEDAHAAHRHEHLAIREMFEELTTRQENMHREMRNDHEELRKMVDDIHERVHRL